MLPIQGLRWDIVWYFTSDRKIIIRKLQFPHILDRLFDDHSPHVLFKESSRRIDDCNRGVSTSKVQIIVLLQHYGGSCSSMLPRNAMEPFQYIIIIGERNRDMIFVWIAGRVNVSGLWPRGVFMKVSKELAMLLSSWWWNKNSLFAKTRRKSEFPACCSSGSISIFLIGEAGSSICLIPDRRCVV